MGHICYIYVLSLVAFLMCQPTGFTTEANVKAVLWSHNRKLGFFFRQNSELTCEAQLQRRLVWYWNGPGYSGELTEMICLRFCWEIQWEMALLWGQLPRCVGCISPVWWHIPCGVFAQHWPTTETRWFCDNGMTWWNVSWTIDFKIPSLIQQSKQASCQVRVKILFQHHPYCHCWQVLLTSLHLWWFQIRKRSVTT